MQQGLLREYCEFSQLIGLPDVETDVDLVLQNIFPFNSSMALALDLVSINIEQKSRLYNSLLRVESR